MTALVPEALMPWVGVGQLLTGSRLFLRARSRALVLSAL